MRESNEWGHILDIYWTYIGVYSKYIAGRYEKEEK